MGRSMLRPYEEGTDCSNGEARQGGRTTRKGELQSGVEPPHSKKSGGEGGGAGGGMEEAFGDFGFGVTECGGDGREGGPVAGFVGLGDFAGVGDRSVGSVEGGADVGGVVECGEDVLHGA